MRITWDDNAHKGSHRRSGTILSNQMVATGTDQTASTPVAQNYAVAFTEKLLAPKVSECTRGGKANFQNIFSSLKGHQKYMLTQIERKINNYICVC